MPRYARINNERVAELFSTSDDITKMFHPSVKWAVADASVTVGMQYIGGVFGQPPVDIIDKNAQINMRISAMEIASLANRGARELHLRIMEKEAAGAATATTTAAQILAKQPYYMKLKALDDEISTLRKGLTP